MIDLAWYASLVSGDAVWHATVAASARGRHAALGPGDKTRFTVPSDTDGHIDLFF